MGTFIVFQSDDGKHFTPVSAARADRLQPYVTQLLTEHGMRQSPPHIGGNTNDGPHGWQGSCNSCDYAVRSRPVIRGGR